MKEDEGTQVLRAMRAQLDAGLSVTLATIVRTRGSTPRKEGARMLVDAHGRILAGTVGGGCGEGEVLEAVRATFADGEIRRVRVDLTEDLLTLSPAVCGGVMDILVERVDPDAESDLG
jgi:xanthine/CO dehydrogenase XdhC/CoxF family maturation factor